MSDSDIIATPQHESDPTYDRVHDKEDHLRASFVREVMDAVADGDDEAARALVAGLMCVAFPYARRPTGATRTARLHGAQIFKPRTRRWPTPIP